MTNYDNLKMAGLPDDAAACVAAGMEKMSDIVGENPHVRVTEMVHPDGSSAGLHVDIDGPNHSGIGLQSDGGGYKPPDLDHKATPAEGAELNAKTTATLNRAYETFHPCQKLIP